MPEGGTMQGSQLKPRVTALDDRAIRTVVSTKVRDFDLRTDTRREQDAFRQGMTLGMTLASLAALLAFIAAGLVR
jgi:hypothetical protein